MALCRAVAVAVAVALLCVSLGWAHPNAPPPSFTSQRPWDLLSAPWTPFNPDMSVNYGMVGPLARFQKLAGVTSVWVPGGMGQWAQLTLEERKQLGELWVTEGKKQGLLVIVHVGAQAVYDAVELARHAREIGAEAIAVMPPFAPDRPATLDVLIQILAMIADASGGLPLYYYHIPGTTNIRFPMYDLVRRSVNELPSLAGIKYVDNNLTDFRLCLEFEDGRVNMMWAPEPKIQALPLGTTSYVLAEPYYAPYLLPVLDYWRMGNHEQAQAAQKKLNDLQHIVGAAAKDVMKMLGYDCGIPRLPKTPISQHEYDAALTGLRAFGFFATFNDSTPTTTTTKV